MQAAFGRLEGFRGVLEEQACLCGTAGHDRNTVVHALKECDSSNEWLDATTSMQLLVLDGRIWIREGRDKSRLRGLADLNPGGRSHLYVLYAWQGQFYEAQGMNRSASQSHRLLLDETGVCERAHCLLRVVYMCSLSHCMELGMYNAFTCL